MFQLLLSDQTLNHMENPLQSCTLRDVVNKYSANVQFYIDNIRKLGTNA